MIEALRRAWGKVRRTPRLPDRYRTGGEAVTKPVYSATIQDRESFETSVAFYTEKGLREIAAPSSWAAYDALMAGHQSYPGWTFCKFGVRGPRASDHSEVQGIVCAPFGAWWAPFLCVDPFGHQSRHGLACVEHTRTGMSIGVFSDMDVAVEAAEIAMRMDDWTGFDIDNDGSLQLVLRARTAWDAAGINQLGHTGYPLVHGKVPDGQGPIAIFIKDPMADHHRPEKLS